MKNYKTQGKIAGILLLISTVLSVIITYVNTSRLFAGGWISIVEWTLSCIIAIGLLSDSITVSKVPAILLLVLSTLSVVVSAKVMDRDYYRTYLFITYCITFLIRFLFVLALFGKGKKAKIMCYTLMGLGIANLLSPYIFTLLHSTASSINAHFTVQSIITIVNGLLPVVAYYFLGKYLESKPKEVKRTVNIPVDNKTTIEKLSILKSLLDKGAITQGEFDEKKKQLLQQ